MLPLLVLLLLPSLPLVTCDDDVTVQSLMTLVQQQAATIQTMQARLTSVENGASSLQTKVASLENGAQQHTGQISSINSRLNTQVFFNAHMSPGPVDVGNNNAPIKFDLVTDNVGNGYNPQTGVFTAPVTGTYVMYTQLQKDSSPTEVHYVIDKSGTILCLNAVDVGLAYDKSSCLAIVHLQKSESAIVRRNDGGERLNGHGYCAFSGVLVSADAS